MFSDICKLRGFSLNYYVLISKKNKIMDLCRPVYAMLLFTSMMSIVVAMFAYIIIACCVSVSLSPNRLLFTFSFSFHLPIS